MRRASYRVLIYTNLRSKKARNKIKDALREEKRKVAEDGKYVLQRKLESMGAAYSQYNMDELVQFYKLPSSLDLHYKIATKLIDLKELKDFQVLGDKIEIPKPKPVIPEIISDPTKSIPKKDSELIIFGESSDKIMYTLAKCCNPIPGDDVFGFVSTGNLNESTSRVYGDHCLLTSNRKIMADINRIFMYLEYPVLSRAKYLRQCKTLVVCPTGMRRQLLLLIDNEIKNARKGLKASIILKMNSLSDEQLIDQLSEAAKAGVEIKLIVRGIFCMLTESSKFKVQPVAISIVDQYLEHSRVLIFHNNGKEKVYLSSADWMIRNLDHRIEAAVEITNKGIQEELKECINIQLKDNVKARILDNNLLNVYVKRKGKTVRSQVEIYNFLHQKILKQLETGRH